VSKTDVINSLISISLPIPIKKKFIPFLFWVDEEKKLSFMEVIILINYFLKKIKKSRVCSMGKKLHFMPYLSRDSNLGITIQENLLNFH